MIPLYDENPRRRIPIVTYLIIAVNVIVFIWELTVGIDYAALKYGFIPAEFTANYIEVDKIFTCMFLHGGFLHLIGNMVFLFVFGDNIEEAFGRLGFFVFYFACGVAATTAYFALNTSSNIPVIGASGAISGVLGAYMVLFPRVRVYTLIVFFRWVTIRRISAGYLLAYWFIIQVISMFLGEQSGIAYSAHVGGFLAGVLLAIAKRAIMRSTKNIYMYA